MAENRSIAGELIPLAQEVHRYLQRAGKYEQFRNWLARRTAYPIILVGATGVGKTSLLRALLGENAHIRREDRTDEVKDLIAKLANQLYVQLFDTPGEVHHANKRRGAYQNAMKHKSIGIINVVSYGYHEGKATFGNVIADGRPSEDYLQSRRTVEVELLKEWTELLCGDAAPASWIVTVVTKADLWWRPVQDQPVVAYYEADPYFGALRDGARLPHSVKPFSATNQLFYETVPMSGYYSDVRRGEDHASLVAHILEKASEHG